MAKYLLAKQIKGRMVITNEGEEFGRVVDLNVNELTGDIEDLIIDPNPDNTSLEQLRTEDDYVLIPFNSVLAVGDYLIVDKRRLFESSRNR
ncbi:MAG: PRC-barrel domain-containing protein [Candidatus Anstonellales archaeon]